MNKKLLAFAAATAISTGAFAATADAASHTVQKGETLWGISQKYSTTVANLKSMNSLSSDIIYPNQSLEVSASAQPASPAQVNASKGVAYTVKQGDTLFRIAKAHGVSVSNLMTWNNIASADRIYAGDTLAVSASAANKTNVTKPSEIVQYQQKQQAPAQTQEAPAATAKTYTMTATAYTAYCTGCSGVTANGTDLRANPGIKVIAVDPSIIPLGSRVWVEGYGEAIAADTGGAIKGNKIDVFIPSDEGAMNWGRRTVTVKVLN